jgi:hypothetical protein
MVISSSKVCLLSSTLFISDDGFSEVEQAGGSQSGGSEGTRSSGSASCTHGGPVSLEGGKAVARRAVLLGDEGERISSVTLRFISLY